MGYWVGYWESPDLKARIAAHYGEAHGIAVNPERIILTCGASPAFVLALSCLFSPGARVALARPVCRLSHTSSTPPSLAQHAAFDCRDELEGHIHTYACNHEFLLRTLPQMGLRRIAPPDGAFYIYADVGHLTNDSLSSCEALLHDTGVAVAPGLDFDPVDGNSFVRFSFAVSTELVEEAIRRMEPWPGLADFRRNISKRGHCSSAAL